MKSSPNVVITAEKWSTLVPDVGKMAPFMFSLQQQQQQQPDFILFHERWSPPTGVYSKRGEGRTLNKYWGNDDDDVSWYCNSICIVVSPKFYLFSSGLEFSKNICNKNDDRRRREKRRRDLMSSNERSQMRLETTMTITSLSHLYDVKMFDSESTLFEYAAGLSFQIQMFSITRCLGR